MKLINILERRAYLMEKVSPYTLFSGEIKIVGKEQSVKWECNIPRLDAVLLGTPKIEVLGTSKGDPRLLEECLFSIKVDGEPAIEMAPLLHSHPRLLSSNDGRAPRVHCWFESDETPAGIFVVNNAILQAIVLAPKIVPEGIHLGIRLEAELYRAKE